MLHVKGENSQQTLTHIHFTGWPDWKTPVGDSQAEFRGVIEKGAVFVE